MAQAKEASSPTAPQAGSQGLVRVLVVDNDIVHARTVGEGLGRLGYQCVVAGSGSEGAKKIDQDSFDVVVTDLMMNDIGGLQILALAKKSSPETEVIVVTGHGTVPSAVAAMQQGAYTYLQKPLDLGQLRTAVEKASEGIRLKRQNVELNRRLDEKFGFEGVVGSSPQMLALIERLKRIAPGSTRDGHRPSEARPRLGAVSFLHRFGSALNHHVHLHACATDGVFVPTGGGPPAFLPARPITQADLATLTEKVRRRVVRWFRMQRLLDADAASDMLRWENSGFSVDASVRITLIDRDVPSYFQSLEHLLRYCARPPFALERLSVMRGEDGRIACVRYVLPRHKAANWVGPGRGRKSTRPGASGVVELSPFEFLDRLADLVPPPRKHRHRYHAVFAPNHKLRRAVTAVAKSPAPTTRHESPRCNSRAQLVHSFPFCALSCGHQGIRRPFCSHLDPLLFLCCRLPVAWCPPESQRYLMRHLTRQAWVHVNFYAAFFPMPAQKLTCKVNVHSQAVANKVAAR